MNRYYVFKDILDFVADFCEVTDADMKNYSGDIEVSGVDEEGATIKIRVTIEEEEKDGN